jgi:hypothetical protein
VKREQMDKSDYIRVTVTMSPSMAKEIKFKAIELSICASEVVRLCVEKQIKELEKAK